ncbi:hypothetical protein LH23_00125 [Cedecea neteri]|uniref:Uncharacterized protein n=1 Tax=Cedecea neteri TaxID=158822 RepID=A0AAN0S0M5_9ENTR|nr:hypothetical protein [Cedecea neteri]AIR59117.1 hypothetical protein LH23_00125 [Cedecea neteri]
MGSFIESLGTFFDGLTKDLRIDSISAKLDGVNLKDYRAEGYATRQAAATPELVPFYAEEYHQIAGNLNFDADTAAKQSERYQVSLYRLETVFDILREKAGSGLAQNLAQPFETLTNTILVSFPKIEPTVNSILSVLGGIANVVGSAINGTIGWVTQLIEWWQMLDGSTQTVIATVAGMIAIWYGLNTAFMASPIGLVLALATSIGLLYDDYMKWRDGGESLINWGAWKPVLELASAMIDGVSNTIKALGSSLGDLLGIDFSKWSISTIFEGLMGEFKALEEMFRQVGKLINALKEGKWSEAMTIGKELVVSSVTQSPAYKMVNGTFNFLDEKAVAGASAFKEWFNSQEKKDTRRRLPVAIDNLSQPDPVSMLLPAGVASNERLATSGDFSTANNSTTHSPTINSNTHIVVNGVSEPHLAATETSERLFNVHSQLAQQYERSMS